MIGGLERDDGHIVRSHRKAQSLTVVAATSVKAASRCCSMGRPVVPLAKSDRSMKKASQFKWLKPLKPDKI